MRSLPTRAAFVLTIVATSFLQLGCGAQKPVQRAHPRPPKLVAETAAPISVVAPAEPYLPSHVIASIDDEQAVPFFARRGDDMLMVYASRGKLYTRLLAVDGQPKDEAHEVGSVVADVFTAVAAPVGDGWLLSWVEASKGNSAVRALSLDASGRARGTVMHLAQSADDVGFLDIVAGTNSALVVWEVPRDVYFDVIGVPVKLGQTPAPAAVLARKVLSWGLAAHDQGAAMAVLVDAATDPILQGRSGRVMYADIDLDGKASAPVMVSDEPTAQDDVLVARVGNRTVVAWTDVRDLDSAVYVAAVERGGRIAVAPKRATPPIGEQAIVSLVASEGQKPRVLLAWEDVQRAPTDGRLIHLSTLDSDIKLGAERATLQFSASGPPDVAADGDGFAITTLAPIGSKSNPVTPETPIWPAFVRLGPDLTVRASEPLRAQPFAATDGIPELTRSLSCHNGTCTAFASVPGPPATFAMIGLPVRNSSWLAPAARDAAETPPNLKAIASIYSGDHLAKVASTEVAGGNSLAAWVTYYVESEDGAGPKPAKKKDPLATVGVRTVSPTGVLGKTQVLSTRAVSIGGVAIDVANAPKQDEALIAWVGRDKAESQIYLAKLDPEGNKTAQKALTTVARKPSKDGVPNECSDVAVAHAPPLDPKGGADDGWVVAWVDTRDGNAEVYAARVDRQLRKVITDRRITDAPGDSAEVQVVVRGNEVVLVWSDARQSTEEGNGDIYAVRLDTRTLREVGPPIRLFASPGHSRSPSIALAGNNVVVAWIEDAASDASSDDAGVRIAVLDERGALAGSPQLIRGEEKATMTSVALTCTAARCRVMTTSSLRENMRFDAFEMAPGAPLGPRKNLTSSIGSLNTDISPSFSSSAANWLFFGDDAGSDMGRVRYMNIAWPGAK